MNSHPDIKLPRLTIVGGRPGAGKTTLAYLLSKRIHCPLISRDAIKEGLVNTMEDKGAPGGFLAQSAGDTFFAVIELLLERRVTLVIDAFFPQESWQDRMPKLKQIARVNLVYCVVDADTAHQRMAQRRQEDAHWDEFHNKPVDQKTMPHARYEPIDLGVPRLIVDCDSDYCPNIEGIFRFTKGLTHYMAEQAACTQPSVA